MDFLELQRVAFPALAEKYEEFGRLYTRKLWHQLTDKLEAFVAAEENYHGSNVLELVTDFVSKFENKVDQLRLCLIVTAAAHQLYPTGSESELERALAFLQVYVDKKARIGSEGLLVLLMDQAKIKMKLGDTEGSKKLVDEGKTLLESLDGSDAVVYSRFYEAAAAYHKLHGPAKTFYAMSIMYLTYTPLESLSTARCVSLAYEMALSALVGDGVYNFGEVVAHPILKSLDGTEHEWLRELLSAFHHGDIDAFNTIVADNRDAWDSQPALGMYEEKVKQKVALLSLMELAAKRPSHERTISFADIAEHTQLAVTAVEWLLMRAMSLGLVKGTIDEVDQTVDITFIQPRVLDTAQVVDLKDKLVAWQAKVHETLLMVESGTSELLA